MVRIDGLKISLMSVILLTALLCGCPPPVGEQGLVDLNRKLELETRLTVADFSIIESDADTVEESYSALSENVEIPGSLEVEFAGKDVGIPPISTNDAIGMQLTNGRSMVVYLFDIPHRPAYGEIIPLALSHYIIPSADLEFVLLLVCFQYDTGESNLGIGVRSLNLDGTEMSAPFAVAVNTDELAGKFFFDEYLEGDNKQAVAGRDDWDQGFLLLTRLDDETVLSTYLPWY